MKTVLLPRGYANPLPLRGNQKKEKKVRIVRRIPLLLFIVVLGFVLSGCGGAAEAPYNNAAEGSVNSDASVSEPVEEAPDTGYDQSQTALQQRIIVMEGAMTVQTYEPEAVVNFIAQLTERYGGYIVDSSLTKHPAANEEERTDGYIKIRVPAGKLNEAISEIESLNLTVVTKDLSGKDVTAEYVDLKSQLRNLEEAAAQLQQIMDNATDTEAVLEVYRELANVNEEAEVIRGQIQYYDDVSSMSSLEVTVNQIVDEPKPTPTPTPKPWSLGPTFEESTEDLSRSMKNWLEGVVWFVVYFIPSFLVRVAPWLLVLYFGGRWVFRKLRKDKKPKEPETE